MQNITCFLLLLQDGSFFNFLDSSRHSKLMSTDIFPGEAWVTRLKRNQKARRNTRQHTFLRKTQTPEQTGGARIIQYQALSSAFFVDFGRPKLPPPPSASRSARGGQPDFGLNSYTKHLFWMKSSKHAGGGIVRPALRSREELFAATTPLTQINRLRVAESTSLPVERTCDFLTETKA